MPCPRENLWCWTASQKIPADVLKGYPRSLFSALCVHADIDGWSAYSIAHLCLVTGQGRSTLYRSLEVLEAVNLVQRVHRHNQRNKYRVNAGLLDFYYDFATDSRSGTPHGANGNSRPALGPQGPAPGLSGPAPGPDSHSSHLSHKEGAAPLKRSSAPQDPDWDQDPDSPPVTPEQRRATLEMLKHLRSKPI